jgi:hypothetical protein
MEDLPIISNLYKILSNAQFNMQFIYFCCGFYNNMELCVEFQSKGMYYIIGKLIYDIKLDIIHYINYLIIIIDNQNSVLNLQNNITTIHNLHTILNSQNKDHFLMFLYGFFNDREEWGGYSQYGNSYIIGKIIALQENKIYIFCKFMINGNVEEENMTAVEN